MTKLLNNFTPLRSEAPEWYLCLAKRETCEESEENTKSYNEDIYSCGEETLEDDAVIGKEEKHENEEWLF